MSSTFCITAFKTWPLFGDLRDYFADNATHVTTLDHKKYTIHRNDTEMFQSVEFYSRDDWKGHYVEMKVTYVHETLKKTWRWTKAPTIESSEWKSSQVVEVDANTRVDIQKLQKTYNLDMAQYAMMCREHCQKFAFLYDKIYLGLREPYDAGVYVKTYILDQLVVANFTTVTELLKWRIGADTELVVHCKPNGAAILVAPKHEHYGYVNIGWCEASLKAMLSKYSYEAR